jgi:hypothetical protein
MATVSTTIELVDKISSKLKTIKGNIDDVEQALGEIGGKQKDIDNFSWDTFIKNAEEAGKKMESVGKQMSIAISAPLLLLGKKMYGNAVDYESAFTGVTKTVTDASEEQLSQLYGDLLDLSERTPTGFVEAAGIMEMAGQIGVATDNLTEFTETYIGLQEATNINGEEGAKALAQFLNVTEKTTDNVDRVSGVIVGLGNNFATTENEILSMATRMSSTADLAGFSSAEILAFSAALSSVGINAEAGGSAAGKLMKQMQLAAEVGGSAQERLANAGINFESALEAQNWLDTMKSSDLADVAYSMGMTKDALEDMVSSWLSLEQFSEVMGLDRAGFLESWDQGAAQSMLRFFQGLGNLDEDSGNSILAQLADMDITEIRLSNLVAAMAGNSALFEAALAEAYRQYNLNPEQNAAAEEVAKRYATQESQNAMLGNKMSNTMADLGQNLVEALNPALEILSDLLDKFNQLSEVDQNKVLGVMGALIVTGPTLMALGKAAQFVGEIATALQKINGTGGLSGAASSATSTAAQAGQAAGLGTAAVGLGAAMLIGAGFKWAAEERNNNTDIRGSVNAINKATEGNADLQQAFIEYIESNAALQAAVDSGDLSNDALFTQVEQATERFQALEGYAQVMDAYSAWRQENSLGNMDWVMPDNLSEMFSASMQSAGANVPEGVGSGITANTGAATGAATAMGTETINAANGALGVNSPSIFMILAGLNVAQGLAQGITTGQGAVTAAAGALGQAAISAASGAANTGALYSVGYNIAMGMASGIRAGSGAVAAAVSSMVSSAIAAGNAAAQVHSPSRLTYWTGEMMVAGYANSITAGRKSVDRAVRGLVNYSEGSWDKSTWSNIDFFDKLERKQMKQGKKSKIKLSEGDVQKIRELAEREVINRFTTAELHVDFTANNRIESDLDLDSVVNYLQDKVAEQLEITAEGAY